MRPACLIYADTVDITNIIDPRLIELSITDEVGMKADRLEITLDDRDSVLELPRKGVRLRVALGYVETGVADMGSWLVDEVSLSGPNPRTMSIRAQAADVQGAIKSHRSKSWANTTLGAVVQTIATAHGMEAVISPTLAKGVITQALQTNESDMHFLSRISRQFGATVKPADGKLIVAQQGKGKSASDKDIPGVNLTLEDITSYSCVLPERGNYAKVIARWHNVRTGKTETVEARGEGDAADGPDFTLNHDYPDKETALSAARAMKDAMDRSTGTLSISMPGNPLAAAEVPLIIQGVRDGIDTTEDTAWRIIRVRHRFARDFTTSIDAEMGDGAVKDKKEQKAKKGKK